jgi:dTDP-4-dehydrorhamnose 3,5-epimerase
VIPEPHQDERGAFARIWSSTEFAAHGLTGHPCECSLSTNPRRGTLRGMHYQVAPDEETKLIVCLRGSVWDVIVDLREDSPTYRSWHGARLGDDHLEGLFVPEGVAHGFLTLSDDVLISYQISAPYAAESARGVRWDDAAFAIEWPEAPTLIGARDRSFPDYDGGRVRLR